MEHAQPGIMKRPPRGQKEGIFSDGLGFNTIYQGVYIAIMTLAAYFIVDMWDGHEVAMTAAFFTLSMCEITQAFTMRSLKGNIFALKTTNKALWGALSMSLILGLAVIYVPFLAEIFSLKPLTLPELAVSLALAISVIPVIETVKAIQRAMEKKRLVNTEVLA
jgi:Ca2+-transporting ATPase